MLAETVTQTNVWHSRTSRSLRSQSIAEAQGIIDKYNMRRLSKGISVRLAARIDRRAAAGLEEVACAFIEPLRTVDQMPQGWLSDCCARSARPHIATRWTGLIAIFSPAPRPAQSCSTHRTLFTLRYSSHQGRVDDSMYPFATVAGKRFEQAPELAGPRM